MVFSVNNEIGRCNRGNVENAAIPPNPPDHEQEIDPISLEPIPQDHRIELESGGVFDARRLFIGLLNTSMLQDDEASGTKSLRNPLSQRLLTLYDLEDLTSLFSYSVRDFLQLWDRAEADVNAHLEVLYSNGRYDVVERILVTQEGTLDNMKRESRVFRAIDHIRSLSGGWIRLADELDQIAAGTQ